MYKESKLMGTKSDMPKDARNILENSISIFPRIDIEIEIYIYMQI